MANVDNGVGLELRRIGGIEGSLKLLRRPLGGAYTGEICARRIELGAALLACGISTAERRGINFFQECDGADVVAENAPAGLRDWSEGSHRIGERGLRSRALISVVQVVQGR